MNKERKFVFEFERMLLTAKAKAYSKLSLERPLTSLEFNEYKKVMGELK